jgi:hypothetical protein
LIAVKYSDTSSATFGSAGLARAAEVAATVVVPGAGGWVGVAVAVGGPVLGAVSVSGGSVLGVTCAGVVAGGWVAGGAVDGGAAAVLGPAAALLADPLADVPADVLAGNGEVRAAGVVAAVPGPP